MTAMIDPVAAEISRIMFIQSRSVCQLSLWAKFMCASARPVLSVFGSEVHKHSDGAVSIQINATVRQS